MAVKLERMANLALLAERAIIIESVRKIEFGAKAQLKSVDTGETQYFFGEDYHDLGTMLRANIRDRVLLDRINTRDRGAIYYHNLRFETARPPIDPSDTFKSFLGHYAHSYKLFVVVDNGLFDYWFVLTTATMGAPEIIGGKCIMMSGFVIRHKQM